MDLKIPLSQLGPKYKFYASRLKKLEIETLEDLLFHIPFRYEDRTNTRDIADIQAGEEVTIQGIVESVTNTYTRKKGFTLQNAIVADSTGKITCTWFNQPYITRAIPEGSRVSITGTAQSPKKVKVKDFEVLPEGKTRIHTGRLVPQYPSTKNVSVKWIRGRLAELLPTLKSLPDHLPKSTLTTHNLLPLTEALNKIHFPDSEEEANEARRRLAFDELLIAQLATQKQKEQWKEKNITAPIYTNNYQKEVRSLLKSLPFELTQAQKDAFESITQDLSQKTAMNRLLQGDVGSGKTVVAAISMYVAHLNGFQSALMAPTEILATQHHKTISSLLEPLGVKVALFTSQIKKGDREKEFHIAVGTHALIHKSVVFDNLGLITIDEQQRFGVEQRAILREKGSSPHVLTMTATPIPRTAFLTLYGELSQTYLDELPKGRKIIKTWVVPKKKRDNAHSWIRKHIDEGKKNNTPYQVFILCPFIEESENMTSVKAATKEYDTLSKGPFKDYKVALLHGRMKAKEKEKILRDFREKKYDIMVTTPVVEVGIDIPGATIMVVEGADRFGLAQLHQLRGRVGRNDSQSYCLLFTENESDGIMHRLKHLENTHLGAQLAEVDLKLRGPGDMYGLRQSGHANFKIASIMDADLLSKAQVEARKLSGEIENHELLHNKLKSTIIRKISRD